MNKNYIYAVMCNFSNYVDLCILIKLIKDINHANHDN